MVKSLYTLVQYLSWTVKIDIVHLIPSPTTLLLPRIENDRKKEANLKQK